MSDKIKIVFMGTPEFALPSLWALANSPDFKVTAVITQPDRPAGRGLKLTPPPIKELAQQRGIRTFQPSSLKGLETRIVNGTKGLHSVTGNGEQEELVHFLNQNKPDFFVVVAYGKIIPDGFLQFADSPILNIHPSLLPRWRGAAPIQHALFSGDTETGVAIMALDEGLDTGPVFCIENVTIEETDDFGMLHDKLATRGAELLVDTIPDVASGKLTAKPQADKNITYAEKWDKEDLIIKWQDSADTTLRRIRTCSPELGARTTYEGKEIKIFEAHLAKDLNYPTAPAGQVVEANKAEIVISSGDGKYISLDTIQFAGKSRLPVKEALRGSAFKAGGVFK